MCFYDQYVFTCGDWKWGSFKQHCSNEYRLGETCGTRLVMDIHYQEKKCRLCEKIDTKMHRRQKEVERIERWQQERKNPTACDRSTAEIQQLDNELRALHDESIKRRGRAGIHHRPASGIDYASQDQSGSKNAKIARKVQSKQHKDGLPIIFAGHEDEEPIMSCADTGSDYNAMSMDLTQCLGFDIIAHDDGMDVNVQLPNRKYITSCGYFKANCTFQSVAGVRSHSFEVTIYVFQELIDPSFWMGSTFLEDTNILSKMGDFLQPRFSSEAECRLRVRLLGNPKNTLRCCFNGIPVEAVPDTGANVDCMSEKFAKKHVEIRPQIGMLEIADGSEMAFVGIAYGELSVGFERPSYAPNPPKELDNASSVTEGAFVESFEDSEDEPDGSFHRVIDGKFHVVPNLVHNLIVGCQTLQALKPYQYNTDEFLTSNDHNRSWKSMNRIFLKRKKKLLSSPQDPEAQNEVGEEREMSQDLMELARREEERHRISTLTGDERAQAEVDENERQRLYNQARLDR